MPEDPVTDIDDCIGDPRGFRLPLFRGPERPPCFDIFVAPTDLDTPKRPSIPASAKRALARSIKQVIDLNGLFNPDKIPF